MTVLAYSSTTLPENKDRYYSSVRGENIEAILKERDYLTLAIPLTDLTHHMISTKEFKLMKSSCSLINMSRGAVVDDTAMIAALLSGEISGAGLDTFEAKSLPVDNELWDLPNILLRPTVIHSSRIVWPGK